MRGRRAADLVEELLVALGEVVEVPCLGDDVGRDADRADRRSERHRVDLQAELLEDPLCVAFALDVRRDREIGREPTEARPGQAASRQVARALLARGQQEEEPLSVPVDSTASERQDTIPSVERQLVSRR